MYTLCFLVVCADLVLRLDGRLPSCGFRRYDASLPPRLVETLLNPALLLLLNLAICFLCKQ